MNLFTNVALGWLRRRVPDWGGWIGTFLAAALVIYNNMTTDQKAMIEQVLSGNWQEITLGAIVPFCVLIVSQVFSFRATVTPQAVTTDGVKIVPKHGSVVEEQINEVAVGVKPQSLKPTLFESLRDALFKRS